LPDIKPPAIAPAPANVAVFKKLRRLVVMISLFSGWANRINYPQINILFSKKSTSAAIITVSGLKERSEMRNLKEQN
jgi:hypothetical protein